MPEKKFTMEPVDSVLYTKQFWNGDVDANAHHYSLTQTWNPQLYDYRQRIKSIRLYLRKLLNIIGDFKIFYTIEYHKKRCPQNEDDLFRPHLHALIEVQSPLTVYSKKEISDSFRKNMGKLELVKLERREDVDNWIAYINKDVEKNETRTMITHRFGYDVQERQRRCSDILEDIEYIDY